MPLNISDFYMNSFLTTGRMYFFVFGGSTGKKEGRSRTTFGGKLIAGEVLLSFGSFRPRKLKNSRECKIFLRGKIFSFDAPFSDASNFRKQQIGRY